MDSESGVVETDLQNGGSADLTTCREATEMSQAECQVEVQDLEMERELNGGRWVSIYRLQALSSIPHSKVTTPFQPQMRWETHKGKDQGEDKIIEG